VKGSTPLVARETTSYDIRAGATMVIAGLVAQGQSVVTDIENIDRGYEKIEERLNAIGANIQRVM
jgi:UDP-N-acetylglucosamine 1-carboxyvinyltransferase